MHSLLLKREAMSPMLMTVLLLYVSQQMPNFLSTSPRDVDRVRRWNHRLNHRFHSGNASTFVTFDSLWTSAFSGFCLLASTSKQTSRPTEAWSTSAKVVLGCSNRPAGSLVCYFPERAPDSHCLPAPVIGAQSALESVRKRMAPHQVRTRSGFHSYESPTAPR